MAVPASVYGLLDEAQQRILQVRQALVEHDAANPDPDPVPDPDEDAWPEASSWSEKIEWIERQWGPKVPTTTITSSSLPAGCRINGSILYLDDCTLLENRVWPGQIRPSNLSSAPITLSNVVAEDVFAGSSDTRARIDVVEDCAFTLPAAKATGSGVLNNCFVPGFVVARTLLQGGADGIQCGVSGFLEDSTIRGLTVKSTTHNDFVQNYGGELVCTRTLFEQLNAPTNHLNGIFCDGGDFDMEDCAVVVTAAPGTNAWALHAFKNGTGDVIRMRRCYVRGRKIGNVVFEEDVDWVAGY
jgi:hypothetical protein